MKSGSLVLQMCSAPRSFSTATCSGFRTIFTSGTESSLHILTSICPRFEAAAVLTMALWFSIFMVSTNAKAVNGLTNEEAASADVVLSSITRQLDAGTHRYWEYIDPPATPTVLPISALALAPASTITPLPSLPTGID